MILELTTIGICVACAVAAWAFARTPRPLRESLAQALLQQASVHVDENRALRTEHEREILRWVARVDASEALVKTLTLELIEQKRLGFAREVAPPINSGPAAAVFPQVIVDAIAFSANGSAAEEARLYQEARRLIGRRDVTDSDVADEVADTIRTGLDESDLFIG